MLPVFEDLCRDMGPENIATIPNGTHNYSKTIVCKRPRWVIFDPICHCSLEMLLKQATLILVVRIFYAIAKF